MENVLEAVSQLFIFIASLVVFAAVIKSLIPAVSLKVHYSVDRWLGRGIKRYKYPSGRAVVYEPHPQVRKYINKYAIFVNDGYKYLKCRLDRYVKTLKFEVIMLNNQNKVIDVLSVYARMNDEPETKELLLHPDTSYVAINIEAINEEAFRRTIRGYYTVPQLLLYFALIAISVFIELLVAAETVGEFLSFVLDSRVLLSSSSFYFVCALFTAAAASFLVVCLGMRKGIGVNIVGKR